MLNNNIVESSDLYILCRWIIFQYNKSSIITVLYNYRCNIKVVL